jgi:hypothetical protein
VKRVEGSRTALQKDREIKDCGGCRTGNLYSVQLGAITLQVYMMSAATKPCEAKDLGHTVPYLHYANEALAQLVLYHMCNGRHQLC